MNCYCQIHSSLRYRIQDCVLVKAECISLALLLLLKQVFASFATISKDTCFLIHYCTCLTVRTHSKSYSLVNGSQMYPCPRSKEAALPLRDDPGFMVPWEWSQRTLASGETCGWFELVCLKERYPDASPHRHEDPSLWTESASWHHHLALLKGRDDLVCHRFRWLSVWCL